MTDTQAELLPCPFCGKPAETGANPPYRIVGGKQQRAPVQKVWCGNEDCPLGSQDFECGVTEWNVRPYPPASAEVVKWVADAEHIAGLVVDAIKDDLPGHIVKRIRRVVSSALTAAGVSGVPEGWVALGVGDGRGQLFVYGPYNAIKECQRKLLAAAPKR